jgi:lysozyme|tara:strand:- start:35 stop:469 length:435 start_codon:yes stop_codon:yes gene_type:complete
MNQDKIKDMLVRHEGLRLHAYKCSEGFLTLGVGRNLDANGISEDEAMYMLDNDIKRVTKNLENVWGVYRTFPEKARMVCIDMSFQMGISGFMNFRQTRELMEMGSWLEASEELLRSKYAIQTPSRALYNSRQLALCQQKQQKII